MHGVVNSPCAVLCREIDAASLLGGRGGRLQSLRISEGGGMDDKALKMLSAFKQIFSLEGFPKGFLEPIGSQYIRGFVMR